MGLVALVCAVESMGIFYAVGRLVGREPDERRLSAGLRAEGLAIALGGTLNSFPYTTFSQNAGLVALTAVRSRFVVAAAGAILLALGCLPKLGALFAVLPRGVLGGAGIALFGMVTAAGIAVLRRADLERTQNQFVVAVALGGGLGVAHLPQALAQLPGALRLLLGDGIVLGTILAVGLNALLNPPEAAPASPPSGS
jgi:xanthine permease